MRRDKNATKSARSVIDNPGKKVPVTGEQKTMTPNQQLQKIVDIKGIDWAIAACMDRLLGAGESRTTQVSMPTNGSPRVIVEHAPKPEKTRAAKGSKPKKSKDPSDSKPKNGSGDLNETALAVLGAFPKDGGKVKTSEIGEKLNMEDPNVRQGLRVLMSSGKVEKLGGGKGTTYRLAQE